MHSKFIVIEGTDFCGKTTQINMLKEALAIKGIRTLIVREPGTTEVGERIRDILKSQVSITSKLTELFLFQAARAELVQACIKPALQAGTWVVSDRFYLSTYVYQGILGNVNLRTIEDTVKLSLQGLEVNHTIYLKGSKAMFLERSKRNLDIKDRFDPESIDTYMNLLNAYNSVLNYAENLEIIDAYATQEVINAKILQTIT